MPAKPTDPMASGPYPTLPDDYGVHARGGDRGPQIRHTDPVVADHCARMLVKHNLDYFAAAASMSASKIPETDDEVRKDKLVRGLAETLKKSPYVAKALQDLYSRIGIDDAAFRHYVAVQWEVYHNGNDKRWPVAARILGEIFGIGKKADDARKPAPLPLQGLDGGLKKMFGDALPSGDAPSLPDALLDDDDTVN